MRTFYLQLFQLFRLREGALTAGHKLSCGPCMIFAEREREREK
jgi:hypothetical protein